MVCVIGAVSAVEMTEMVPMCYMLHRTNCCIVAEIAKKWVRAALQKLLLLY